VGVTFGGWLEPSSVGLTINLSPSAVSLGRGSGGWPALALIQMQPPRESAILAISAPREDLGIGREHTTSAACGPLARLDRECPCLGLPQQAVPQRPHLQPSQLSTSRLRDSAGFARRRHGQKTRRLRSVALTAALDRPSAAASSCDQPFQLLSTQRPRASSIGARSTGRFSSIVAVMLNREQAGPAVQPRRPSAAFPGDDDPVRSASSFETLARLDEVGAIGGSRRRETMAETGLCGGCRSVWRARSLLGGRAPPSTRRGRRPRVPVPSSASGF
jgi:hypothetical protein